MPLLMRYCIFKNYNERAQDERGVQAVAGFVSRFIPLFGCDLDMCGFTKITVFIRVIMDAGFPLDAYVNEILPF